MRAMLGPVTVRGVPTQVGTGLEICGHSGCVDFLLLCRNLSPIAAPTVIHMHELFLWRIILYQLHYEQREVSELTYLMQHLGYFMFVPHAR